VCEFNALKKHGIGNVGVLFCVHDVSANRANPCGDSGHDARLVGTRDKEDGRGIHRG
jgi:hypothetical protein